MVSRTGHVFNITKDNEPIANATVTATIFDYGNYRNICYSMGRGTGITPERHHLIGLILVDSGTLKVIARDGDRTSEIIMHADDIFARPAMQLIGFQAEDDCVFTEIDFPILCHLNEKLLAPRAFCLPDFVSFDSGHSENAVIAECGMYRFQILSYPQEAFFSAECRTRGSARVYEGQVKVKYGEKALIMNPGDNLILDRQDLVERHVSAHTKLSILQRID